MQAYRKEFEGVQIFAKIRPEDFPAMLGCLGAFEKQFSKLEYLALDGAALQYIGLVLRGAVQMIKEDIWGGKSLLASIGKGSIFGESIVCGGFGSTVVSFVAVEDSTILFLPFTRVLHTCGHACAFHQQLIENMVFAMAQKSVFLMKKMEITAKKSIRERVLTWLSQEVQRTESSHVKCAMGRLELADYLCVDRCALTRELARMKADGLIDYDKNTFFLKPEKT